MGDLFTDPRLGDLDDQIACVKREIGFRKRVYPRQILQGRLKRDAADREIATMQAVLATLATLPHVDAVVRAARAIRDQNGHLLDHALAADLDQALAEVERVRRTVGSMVA